MGTLIYQEFDPKEQEDHLDKMAQNCLRKAESFLEDGEKVFSFNSKKEIISSIEKVKSYINDADFANALADVKKIKKYEPKKLARLFMQLWRRRDKNLEERIHFKQYKLGLGEKRLTV